VIEDAERMSPGFQSRLLAYIEQQPAPPAAGRHVRFITVANSSLFDLVRCDEFCEPLFYRMNTIHVMIPPLRDRPGDIPVLLRHFMSTAGQLRPARLTPAAWQRLMTYEWPGNIPELREVADALIALRIERAIDLPDLPAALKPPFDM
jgi:DNA-binding NtrC family response regulator